jgi:Tol biopolymer transport system component
MRFDYELPTDRQFSALQYPALAISPDGKQFVYSTAEGLFLRSVDEFTAKLIAGTQGSTSQPFFSPDGKWVGYLSVADFTLKKININGGAPATLCNITPFGVDWRTDGTIICGQTAGDLMIVSSNGGSPEPLLKSKLGVCLYPQMLPDGKTVLYTAAVPQPRIMVQSIESGEPKELFAGIAARYLPTGHIVYGLSNSLFAVPFDLDTLKVTGGAVPVVENVISPLHYVISDSGTLIYIPGTTPSGSSYRRSIVWVDRNGKEEPLSAEPNDYRTPRISPDGTKVTWTVVAGEKADIWTWDISRETPTRLTFDGLNRYPLWTPDGGRIAFAKGDARSGLSMSIYWKAADGTGAEEKLGSAQDQLLLPWSWSKDGNTMALFEADISAGINYNVGILSMEGNREWKSLLKENYIEFQPKISPDGKWVAYTSSESGQVEICTRPFPDLDKGKWQVSTSGGDTPLWSPDGRELFYRNGNAVMGVPVETDPGFKVGKPATLFQGNYVLLSTDDGQPWDIHPDGKRFLMIKPAAPSGGESTAETLHKINIVLNFFEELKEKAPLE